MADLELQHATARGPLYMVIATAALTVSMALLAFANASTSDARARYEADFDQFLAQSLRSDRFGEECERTVGELIAGEDPELDPDTVFESPQRWPDFREIREYILAHGGQAEGAETTCRAAVRESEAALELVPDSSELSATLTLEKWMLRGAVVAFFVLMIMASAAMRSVSNKINSLTAARQQLIDAEQATDAIGPGRQNLIRSRGPAVGTTRLTRRQVRKP